MLEHEHVLYIGHNDELENLFNSISYYIGYSMTFIFGVIISFIRYYIV